MLCRRDPVRRSMTREFSSCRESYASAILVDRAEAFDGSLFQDWISRHRGLVLGLHAPLILRICRSVLVVSANGRIGPHVEPSLVELDYLS